MKEETENAMIGSFVNMVKSVELDDAIDVVRVTCDIFANTLGCAVVRKLADCDCSACRSNMVSLVDSVVKQSRQDVEDAINQNLANRDMELLFCTTTHNEQVTKEILSEIKKGV